MKDEMIKWKGKYLNGTSRWNKTNQLHMFILVKTFQNVILINKWFITYLLRQFKIYIKKILKDLRF